MIDESINKVNDIFGAFLIEESNWVGVEEYPRVEEWMVPINPPIRMIPFDKINEVNNPSEYFICFYCKDESFIKILKNPKKYVNMLRKFAGIIGFDYSIYTDMPIIKQKSQIYNNLSLSYFFGNNGIPVIPNIRYGIENTKEDFLKAIPKNSLIAFGTYGFIRTIKEQQVWFDTLHKVINQLKPSGVVVYGSLPKDLRRWIDLYQVPVYLYESYTSLKMKEVKKNANQRQK
ncbi:MAG: DUF4417 domain-containing protein [Bacilli bacterium]|nr:DUF4417 domain-containing protein [Bacilli bacterium]